MKVEIFTVATQSGPRLERLQASFSKFGVVATVLGQEEPEYWGHGWKWKTFVRAVKTSQADVVAFCDGHDSVCLGPITGLAVTFASLSHPIVFSYEPQAQPEFWLGLNSGLVVAEREALLKTFHDRCLEKMFPDHFNDQFQIQAMYSWNPEAFKLDRDSVLFHTLGPRSPELVVQNNWLVNPATGSQPSFVHAPRGWDLSRIDQWVAANP